MAAKSGREPMGTRQSGGDMTWGVRERELRAGNKKRTLAVHVGVWPYLPFNLLFFFPCNAIHPQPVTRRPVLSHHTDTGSLDTLFFFFTYHQ
jgi:hypothetical protein